MPSSSSWNAQRPPIYTGNLPAYSDSWANDGQSQLLYKSAQQYKLQDGCAPILHVWEQTWKWRWLTVPNAPREL